MFLPNVPAMCVDSSFAGSGPDLRLRLHTGTIIMMNVAPFCAEALFHVTIAYSSCYAETTALHSTAEDTESLRRFFEKLHMKLEEASLVLDNDSATISIMGLSSNSSTYQQLVMKFFFAKNLQNR